MIKKVLVTLLVTVDDEDEKRPSVQVGDRIVLSYHLT